MSPPRTHKRIHIYLPVKLHRLISERFTNPHTGKRSHGAISQIISCLLSQWLFERSGGLLGPSLSLNILINSLGSARSADGESKMPPTLPTDEELSFMMEITSMAARGLDVEREALQRAIEIAARHRGASRPSVPKAKTSTPQVPLTEL